MKSKKENRSLIAIAGTILFHGVLGLLLILLALKTPLPLPAEQGVEVNLGNSEEGMGFQQPQQVPKQMKAEMPPPKPVERPKPSAREKILTQDNDENPALPNSNKKPKPKTEAKPAHQEPKTIPVKPKEEPKVNQDALYKPSSGTSLGGQNQGISGKPGDQGSPGGNLQSDNYTGIGGSGGGISFDLGGRGALSLPKPGYDSKEQGKVVVSIWVDRDGRVIEAREGAKGTTISDSRLRKIAREAALKARFKSDPDAPEKQSGTITYNFIRLN